MKTFRVLAPACILVGLISGAVELQGHLRSDFPIHRLLGTNSLFAISPILILAFMRLKETIPVRACSHAERRVWLITILYATLFAVIVPVPNTVGVHWGCRFLLILYPLFAVLAAVNWSRAWPAAHTALVVRVLLILSLVLSVITQVYSLSILIRKKDFNADFNDMLAEQTQDIVVTVGWFIPLDLARSFHDKKLFLVDGQVSADRLANRLHDAGYREYLFVAPVARRPNEPPPPDVFHDGTLNFTTAVVRRRSLPSGEYGPARRSE